MWVFSKKTFTNSGVARGPGALEAAGSAVDRAPPPGAFVEGPATDPVAPDARPRPRVRDKAVDAERRLTIPSLAPSGIAGDLRHQRGAPAPATTVGEPPKPRSTTSGGGWVLVFPRRGAPAPPATSGGGWGLGARASRPPMAERTFVFPRRGAPAPTISGGGRGLGARARGTGDLA